MKFTSVFKKFQRNRSDLLKDYPVSLAPNFSLPISLRSIILTQVATYRFGLWWFAPAIHIALLWSAGIGRIGIL